MNEYNPYFNPDWSPQYTNNYAMGRNLNQAQQPFGRLNAARPISPEQYQNVNGVGVKPIKFDSSGAPKPTGGVDAAGVASGAVGLLDVGLNAGAMANEAKAIQTKAPTAQYDAFGRPVYNLGGFEVQTNRVKPRGASGGEVLSGVGKGAAAGAQIGSAIPVVGTAIGAIGGAIIGGISNLIGGRRRKRKMEERKRKANKRIAQRQQTYNQGILADNQNRAAMQTYYDQINNTDRMYNLYQNG